MTSSFIDCFELKCFVDLNDLFRNIIFKKQSGDYKFVFIMSTAVQTIPEAAQLHIRISDSDDESDGEQQVAKRKFKENGGVALQPQESSDALSQLAKTAQATAEAAMRVTDCISSPAVLAPALPAPTIVAEAGDNVINTLSGQLQQLQPQFYYLPKNFACPSPSVYSFSTDQSIAGDTSSIATASQSLVSTNTYKSLPYQIPRLPFGAQVPIPGIAPGTVIYHIAPPQSPLPSSQFVYQLPSTPLMNYPALKYLMPEVSEVPEVQYVQSDSEGLTQIREIPEDCEDYEEEYRKKEKREKVRRSEEKLTIGDFVQSSSTEIVYPMVYVSPAGLLTVLLKHDVAVEMTLDKTIRVVNHKHNAAAACNSKGSSSCIFHSMAKVYQDTTTCEAECFNPNRQLSITTEYLKFSMGLDKCYQLNNKSYDFTFAYPGFRDLSKDMSVSLLFSSHKYGPHLIDAYQEVANQARYRKHRSDGTTVYINGMKIHQYKEGDVVVHSGQKYIRVSPVYGSMMIGTHYVEILLESSHTLKVRRGDYRFKVTEDLMVMSDGYMECGMDMASLEVFCQLELLMVRTIIDNREPCDLTRTGSREAYDYEEELQRQYQRRRSVPMLGYRAPRPRYPTHPVSPIEHMFRTFLRQQGWNRRRGRSHYTIDLQTAIRLAKSERMAKAQIKELTTSESEKEAAEPAKLWSNIVISEKAVQEENFDSAPKSETAYKTGAGTYQSGAGKYDSRDHPRYGRREQSHKGRELCGREMKNRKGPIRGTTRNSPTVREDSNRRGSDNINWRNRGDGYDGSRKRDQAATRGNEKSYGRNVEKNERGEDRTRIGEGGKKVQNENEAVKRVQSIDRNMSERRGNLKPKVVPRKMTDNNGKQDNRQQEKAMQVKNRKGDKGGLKDLKTAKSANSEPAINNVGTSNRKSSKIITGKKSPRESMKNPKNTSSRKQSPREDKELRIKISPRDSTQKKKSPRDKITPRGSIKPSPRDRQSPRNRRVTRPLERRNKKKRSTRRYTDTPEKLQAHVNEIESNTEQLVQNEDVKSEQIVQRGDEIKSERLVQNEAAHQKVKASGSLEKELLKFAAKFVQGVVTKAAKVCMECEQEKQKAKQAVEKRLEQTASNVLKHVFHIAAYKWKMYYSKVKTQKADDKSSEIDCLENEAASAKTEEVTQPEEKQKREAVQVEEIKDVTMENKIFEGIVKQLVEDVVEAVVSEMGRDAEEEHVAPKLEPGESVISSDSNTTASVNKLGDTEQNVDTTHTGKDIVDPKLEVGEMYKAVISVEDKLVEESEAKAFSTTEDEVKVEDSGSEKEERVELKLQAGIKAVISSDEELSAEEAVNNALNTTVSADNLEVMTSSKVSKRQQIIAPTAKMSEPNVHVKENHTLRSTKSEVNTASTGVEVKFDRKLETQNNSEGNITNSTSSRLKAIEQRLPSVKVEIQTINIATNEHGSGESYETASLKFEAAQSVDG